MRAAEVVETIISAWDWGTVPDWFTALFAGLALLVVFAAVGQLRLHNRQLHRELENQYLQRFWSLWDARSKTFRRTGKSKHARPGWIQDYLMLSNDQIELRGRGRVTDDTWDFWARDIARFCFAYPELVREAEAKYPAVWRLLSDERTKLAVADRSVAVYDPLGWPSWKRWRQGLSG